MCLKINVISSARIELLLCQELYSQFSIPSPADKSNTSSQTVISTRIEGGKSPSIAHQPAREGSITRPIFAQTPIHHTKGTPLAVYTAHTSLLILRAGERKTNNAAAPGSNRAFSRPLVTPLLMYPGPGKVGSFSRGASAGLVLVSAPMNSRSRERNRRDARSCELIRVAARARRSQVVYPRRGANSLGMRYCAGPYSGRHEQVLIVDTKARQPRVLMHAHCLCTRSVIARVAGESMETGVYTGVGV